MIRVRLCSHLLDQVLVLVQVLVCMRCDLQLCVTDQQQYEYSEDLGVTAVALYDYQAGKTTPSDWDHPKFIKCIKGFCCSGRVQTGQYFLLPVVHVPVLYLVLLQGCQRPLLAAD